MPCKSEPTVPRVLDRRALLRAMVAGGFGVASFGGGGSGLFEGLARAATADSDLRFVFCYFEGGWDVLLGLDPRDPAVFDDAHITATQIQPAYNRLNAGFQDMVRVGDLAFGPYIGGMRRHADKLAVVRGMSMETLSHDAGRRRFITGKPPSGTTARGSATATWLASRLGGDALIPQLAINVESFNVDQPAYASAVTTGGAPQLAASVRAYEPALMPTATLDDVDSALEALTRLRAAGNTPLDPVIKGSSTAHTRARTMLRQGLGAHFDLLAETPEMQHLRDLYGLSDVGSLYSNAGQMALAAQAITSGTSRVVSVNATGGLDTHFGDWQPAQGPRQQQGFDAVARLIDDLSTRQYAEGSDSWLDHTVIVGFSEFSRTPLLNGTSGRDHHLTNSCFLAGGGVIGGRALGRSSDYAMGPVAVDLASGRERAQGTVPRPENVWQAIYERLGLGDIADLRVEPYSAIFQAA